MKRLLATAALVSALGACATGGAASGPVMATSAVAESPYESEILATVDRFLLALGNHDDEALEEVLITEGVSWIQTIKTGEEGKVQPYTNEGMLAAALYNQQNDACSLAAAQAARRSVLHAGATYAPRLLRGPERENRILLPRR